MQPSFYARYQQGFYQEVYDELLALGEEAYREPFYAETLSVTQAIMQRVRHNIELLIPRLHALEYNFLQFLYGYDLSFASFEEIKDIERKMPIFQPPTSETPGQVAMLEQITGPLPLSLKCWFEIVGGVNFIGLFPSNEQAYGCVLDPLWVSSVETVLDTIKASDTGTNPPMVMDFAMITDINDDRQYQSLLFLAPVDSYGKYGYSGGWAYGIPLPCRAIDAPFLNESHNTTFVNYLRLCIQWGGLPGLAEECRLSRRELTYLTEGLLAF